MNLKEEILKLTNTAPIVRDEQDLSDDDTAAKICSNDFDDELVVDKGNNRKYRSFIDLSEVNDKYKGKVVSRSKLKKDNGFESDEDEKEEDEDEEEEEEDEDGEEEEDEENSERDDDNDDVDNDEGIDDLNEDNDTSNKKRTNSIEEDDNETNIKVINFDNSNSEVKKGLAIKHQINFWESLLDNRMKFQNLLADINQYPRYDELDFFTSQANDNTKSLIESNENLANELLNELNDLTNNITNVAKEMAQLDLNENDDEDDDDDNIDSDNLSGSDDEDNNKKILKRKKDKKSKSLKKTFKKKYKKIKFEETEKYLDNDYNEFIEYRNTILQKWYEKTSLFTSKNNIPLEKPIMQQIENLLLDKRRIIKRTQLKRIVYEPLRKQKDDLDKKDIIVSTDDYDVEIFDDYDFYQQLLRELVNRRTFDILDPILLSKNSIELQKLKLKKKKNVDTKASKGRKLRFDVHKSLVNFMVPIIKNTMTEEAKNDLYSTLFENHAVFGTS